MSENLNPGDDPIEVAITEIRRMYKAGVDRCHLPRVIVGDLLDQADRYDELRRFKLEYGVNEVLNHLPDDGSRERFLSETLGLAANELGIYELPRATHTGSFWKDGADWSWFIRFPDGTCR
jgi:hypothetical protein